MNNTDPVFDTGKERLQEIWNEFQILQVEFAFRQELALFYQSTSWIASRRVLDAGCGNGYYLDELFKHFPDKAITGVDISHDLINNANTERKSEHLSFIVGDYLEINENFDAVIMRLFLQHLQNPIEALEKANDILSAKGCVLIIDSVDSHRYYYPDIPRFRALFDLYRDRQDAEKRDRNIASSLVDYAHKSSNWDIEINQDIVIPSTLHGNQNLFLEIYMEFVNMVEAVGEIDYPFDIVRNELTVWSGNGGYTQIGLKLLSLTKT